MSTGAGVALAGLPIARMLKVPYFYIESVSRFEGPSLTGRLMEWVPFVSRFAQHDGYRSDKWKRVRSLLASYRVVASPTGDLSRPLSIFVSLGTIAPYRFDRLVDSVLACLHPDDTVTWQLGVTERSDLPGAVHGLVPADEMARLMRDADVVVTHAGVGTLLNLLDQGMLPVAVARLREHGEHVDDHQLQVLQRLSSLGLAVSPAASLERAHLIQAADSRVVQSFT
ncbi:glycosyltransferase [Herbiconiux sp. SYSU D00978]|uniref:glycosyltransferase n=1 Tax=Herbiconiux sp. SYSU D00978 TaxID=2812562 RepID=UPI001A96C7BD|nr:glycosyltransferase [Herbiconiux sp. SYSU D00978]